VTLGVDALAEAFYSTMERLVGSEPSQPSEDAA
jgi:hypothetical protein